MLDTIRTIILDFQESRPETGVPRRVRFETLRGKAAVCIGVRRSGKSTFMFQLMKRLTDSGVSRQNILHINFFDDRLRDLRSGGLGRIMDAYYSIYPEKKNSETVYCFFDEIQMASEWEAFVDRLMRTENCDVYLTGSSSRMLSREIATQMRGRALSWEMFPFSFREFLDFKGVEWNGPLTSQRRLLVEKTFNDFRDAGGFPEVAGADRTMRVKIHQEYFNTVLFRDLIERYDAPHPRAISDLAHRLMESIGSPYSVNSLHGYLQSLAHKASKTSVAEYLEWFEDAYFLFTVRIFDASLARANANPKKAYCVDHAMIRSVASGILINDGHILENMVFTALRRLHPDVRYYRTKSGREVDFIVPSVSPETGDRTGWRLVQVCESMADPRTRKREVTALLEAMDEMKEAAGTIVTRDEEDQIDADGKRIVILPARRFLLTLPE